MKNLFCILAWDGIQTWIIHRDRSRTGIGQRLTSEQEKQFMDLDEAQSIQMDEYLLGMRGIIVDESVIFVSDMEFIRDLQHSRYGQINTQEILSGLDTFSIAS